MGFLHANAQSRPAKHFTPLRACAFAIIYPPCFHRRSNPFTFIGIGGTAMASAAAAMQEKGFAVTGSDQNVYPPMSTFLADAGDRGHERLRGAQPCGQAGPGRDRQCHFARQPGGGVGAGPQAALLLAAGIAEEFFIRGKRSIVVAGTHGKTTTTSLLTWVFEHNGLNPSYLIGGIPNNLSQGARFTDCRLVHHRGRRIRHGIF